MPDLRMPEINHATISGRIASDITDHDFATGNTVAEFNFAHSHYVSGQGKDRKDETTWLRVKCWGELARRVQRQLAKGDPLIVEGRLSTEEWAGRDGKKERRTVLVAHRVQPLAWPAKDGEQRPAQQAQQQQPSRATQPVDEDEIPF